MFFLLHLREKRKTAAPIRARATTPPTTPPAMAPTLLELFLLLVLSSLPSLPVEGELVAEEDVWLPRLLAEDVVDGKI